MKTKLKKSFAAFLALVMCLGMLPTSVFAAPGAADGQIEVPGGSKYYNAGGVEVSASALGENNAVVGLSKNIAATELENVFDITLTVETTLEQEKNFTITEAPDAAVLLTFDLSGTMGREDISSTQTRIEAARSAAQNFINQYKNSAGNTDAKRMLAIVGFDTDAYVIMDWIDVNPKNNSSATASIDNAFRTYSKCTGPGTHSGDRVDAKPCTCASDWTGNTLYWGRHSCTNFDGGMILSRNMLKADAVKNVAKGNTWNFILSDGAPTVTVASDTTSVGTIASSFWDGTSWAAAHKKGGETDVQEITNSKSYLAGIAEEANVFMIGVGVTDKPFGNWSNISPAVTTSTTTGQWLNSLATAVGGHYEDVTDTAGMTNAFNRLFNQIKATADEETIESSAWNTVDPIGGTSTPYVEFMGFFGGSNGNTYKGKDNTSITKAADGDKADWANNKIDWDLKDSVYTKVGDVYTYSIKYRVRLANERAEFAENTALITNGTTTFSYQTVTNNEFGPVKTVNFPIPQIEGYLADVSFTKVDENGNPLSGAAFELTHAANCTCGLPSSVDVDANIVYEKNGASHSFSRIPSGHTYTLTETAPAGYVAASSYTVTVDMDTVSVAGVADLSNWAISNTPAKTSVTVTKEWSDYGDQDGLRPASVQVQLKADNAAYGDPITLNADNNWTYTWTNLDKAASGSLISYTVEEISVPNGYTARVSGTANNGFTVTNSHLPAEIDISVKKEWVDDANDGRPDSIQVQLKANDKVIETVTLSENNQWKHTWENMPAKSGGATIRYTVDEADVPANYEKQVSGNTESGFTVTNTSTLYDLTIVKTLSGNDTSTAVKFPISVTLTDAQDQPLVIQGVTDDAGVVSIELSGKDGENSYTIENLPKGTKYHVEETNSKGYTATYTNQDGTMNADATATVNNEKNYYRSTTISHTVVKNWADDDDVAQLRPDSIQVQLYNDDVKYGAPVTLNAANNWTYTWQRLSKYGDWHVDEVQVPDGYTKSVATSGTTTTITNTIDEDLIPKTVSRTVIKVWDDDNNSERPASVSVQLYNGETAYGEAVILNAENGWTYTWNGLDDDGNWTVAEVEVPDGYSSAVTVAGTTFTVTNTYDDTEYEEILDEDVPLGDIPETGDASAIWMAMSALSGAGLFLTRKKREDEE